MGAAVVLAAAVTSLVVSQTTHARWASACQRWRCEFEHGCRRGGSIPTPSAWVRARAELVLFSAQKRLCCVRSMQVYMRSCLGRIARRTLAEMPGTLCTRRIDAWAFCVRDA